MPEKLLTVQELAGYLEIAESKVIELVDKKVISGYRIGGELLRFRKDQIDAIRREIDSYIVAADRTHDRAPEERKEKLSVYSKTGVSDSFPDRVSDFFYFNDFYIVSIFTIAALLFLIFRG